MMRWILVVMVGGCGSGSSSHLGPADGAVTLDGPLPAAETLCGNAPPTTAAPMISIRGSIGIYPDVVNLSGTVVEIWQEGGSAPLASETIGAHTANADFDIAVPTNGVPLRGYVRGVRGPGFVDAYWYPPAAYAANDDNSQLPILYARESHTLFESGAPDPSRGVIDLLISDCDGNDIYSASPIYNATVTVSPMLPTVKIRYSANVTDWKPAPDATTTVVRIEADSGPITITAATPTRSLRTTRIEVRANMHANVVVKPQ